MTTASHWAPAAWIDGGWQSGVHLEVDAGGCWRSIQAGVAAPPAGARVLPGPALPGLVDAHSHAFQRAFAGLAERRSSARDDFWSWRERMYGTALRVRPEALGAIAAQLYAELLEGGYTQVCEFHYLHHHIDGQAYPDPAALGWVLADSAQRAGIGITLLPVLYERSGFRANTLRGEQRRFATDVRFVAETCRRVHAAALPGVSAGVAVHSLRAAGETAMRALIQQIGDTPVPIHIHAAEQLLEVSDCLDATGRRPLAWLCERMPVDERWQLVHATHATASEIRAVARAGAGVVLCPATEANLGDGLSDLPAWLAAGVPLSIGSDSQVCRQWTEELRWLEYGQRLRSQERNVAAAPEAQGATAAQDATAARLFDLALAAGGRAAGLATWGLRKGARADWLVLDTRASGLLGIPSSHWLDATVFATDRAPFAQVYVAGQLRVEGGRHVAAPALAAAFEAAMAELWGPEAQAVAAS